MTAQPTAPPSRLLAYLQLMRLPNVFTAMADIAMGFLFTHQNIEPVVPFAFLVLSSSCLYLSGMVLNDVWDVEIDRRERSFRPLPSGRITERIALLLWFGLSVAGLAASVAAAAGGDERPPYVAFALCMLIIFYNIAAKRTFLGPAAMGGCRALNVLLGMSLGATWMAENWLIAGGIGVYVAGVTWFARGEAGTSPRLQLVGALASIFAGMAILWWFPNLLCAGEFLLSNRPQNWTLLWVLLAVIIGWRAFRAILQPDPAHVQAAVKTGILSIIVLDAVVVFAVHGPVASIAIVLLLIPTIALGWFVYST